MTASPVIPTICNLLGYFDTETAYNPESDPDSESAIKVFQTLLGPVTMGHHIFADRYYTTRNLLDYLLRKHYYYTGTVHSNRSGFPPEMKAIKIYPVLHF